MFRPIVCGQSCQQRGRCTCREMGNELNCIYTANFSSSWPLEELYKLPACCHPFTLIHTPVAGGHLVEIKRLLTQWHTCEQKEGTGKQAKPHIGMLNRWRLCCLDLVQCGCHATASTWEWMTFTAAALTAYSLDTYYLWVVGKAMVSVFDCPESPYMY